MPSRVTLHLGHLDEILLHGMLVSLLLADI